MKKILLCRTRYSGNNFNSIDEFIYEEIERMEKAYFSYEIDKGKIPKYKIFDMIHDKFIEEYGMSMLEAIEYIDNQFKSGKEIARFDIFHFKWKIIEQF